MSLKLKLMCIENDKFIPLSYTKFNKLPGVYIIKNIINGKEYVGESINIYHRLYLHRTKDRRQVISKAIHKYGIENFTVYVEYLPNFKKNDLLLIEEHLIRSINSLSPSGYNICAIGKDCPSRRGIPRPPRSKTWCDNLSKGLKGRIISEKTKQKMSLSRIGKPLSDITREKIS